MLYCLCCRVYGKDRMAKDVAELKRLNQELHNECVIEETDRKQLKGDLKPYSNDVVGYRIRYLLLNWLNWKWSSDGTLVSEIRINLHYRENITACYLAAFAELPFVNKIRSVQMSKWEAHSDFDRPRQHKWTKNKVRTKETCIRQFISNSVITESVISNSYSVENSVLPPTHPHWPNSGPAE